MCIRVDHQKQKVLVLGYFNASNSAVLNEKKFLVSVPLSNPGSGPTTINVEYPIESEINYGSGFRNLFRLLDYLEAGQLLYTGNYERLAPSYGRYDPSSKLFNPFWSARGFSFALTFDEPAQKTYVCDFSIQVINSIPKNKGDALNYQTMYDRRQCTFITNLGEYIYFVYNTGINGAEFYRGLKSCRNCDLSTLKLLFTIPSDVSDLAVSSTKLYYSQKSSYQANQTIGIYEVPLDGDLSQKRTLVTESVSSIDYSAPTNYIYYTTSEGNKIKRVSISNPSNIETLYDPNISFGNCRCSEGFQGPTCSNCSNGIISWQDGQPHCIPLDSDGVPTSCFNDYECNLPFGYCTVTSSGLRKCACRQNFVGPKCDQCFGTITWDYGYPSCNV
eukprot:gene4750-5927_t